jgi:hypothetical protein
MQLGCSFSVIHNHCISSWILSYVEVKAVAKAVRQLFPFGKSNLDQITFYLPVLYVGMYADSQQIYYS